MLLSSQPYLVTFFKHDDYAYNQQPILLYAGTSPQDLKLYKELPIKGRDPSIIKRGDTYYILVTDYSLKNPHDMTIYTTKDFEKFQRYDLSAGLLSEERPHVWASDFFVDKTGQLWVVTSVNDRGREKTYTGYWQPSFSPYLVPLDLEKMTLGKPRKLELADTNYIDGYIFTVGSQYNMVIKDETNKQLELWSSEDLLNWKQDLDIIPNTGRWVEGASVLYDKESKEYTIYIDQYNPTQTAEAGMYYVKTKDFKSFSKRYRLVTDQRVRHGSGIVDDNFKPKKWWQTLSEKIKAWLRKSWHFFFT
ncbi:hypothetical protein [Streptococcus cuniculipharyngis]|uniref:Glycosyl hydrolases family 43 n=1 Tax=Streptococcus cuniculipharyngis TaxID=1562651 RepID=A0A5C5SE41_9STRE|nr:hypothetical protein [Streptococcus cuniculipharyngis]TWS99084.1 hypothetical protein FRX57_02450 [Streptococcus cuniculipharyngis]